MVWGSNVSAPASHSKHRVSWTVCQVFLMFIPEKAGGVYLGHKSYIPEEAEFLLDKGQKFRILTGGNTSNGPIIFEVLP